MALRRILRNVPGARRLVRSIVATVEPQSVPAYYCVNAHKKIRIDLDVPGFSEIASRVIADQKTSLNYDRLYILWQALQAVRDESIVVEVGVYRGGSARFLSQAMTWMGKRGEVFACDTFTGHPVVDERIDGGHKVNEGFADVVLSDVREYLAGCDNLRLVVGNIMERADAILSQPVGVLHIDVDVYPATLYCLEHFKSRVDIGGVVVVDDYGFVTCAGAKKAVDEFVSVNPEWRFFHLTTGQGLVVRTA